MLTIELTEREAGVLQEVLTYYLSELRMEIADTDRYAFRQNLKEKEKDINKILSALSQTSGEQPDEEKNR